MFDTPVDVTSRKHPKMELDGADSKDLSVEGQYHRIIIYFLVSCFCDWIYKQGIRYHQRKQSVELRQWHTNQHGVLLQCNTNACNSNKEIKQNRCGLPKKRGHKASVQGLAICLESHKGMKNSLGLGYSISVGAACHYGYDFKCKHCGSDGGVNLNAVDKRAGRTGLNLHFILIILFSTNKLTPEKT